MVNADTTVDSLASLGEDALRPALDDVRDVQWGHRPYRTPLYYAAGPECPHLTDDPEHPEHLAHSWPDGDVLCMLRVAGYGCSYCESEDCEADARRAWLADDVTDLWWLVSDSPDAPRLAGSSE